MFLFGHQSGPPATSIPWILRLSWAFVLLSEFHSFTWLFVALAEVSESAEDSSTCASGGKLSRQLLVASNGRFFWFDLDTYEERLLHDAHGVYFGSFAGEPTAEGDPTVWVVGRRESHFAKKTEHLVQLIASSPGSSSSRSCSAGSATAEAEAGAGVGAGAGAALSSLREVPLPGGWGVHDAVRLNDRVFVASTISGEVLELEYPAMSLVASHKLFERGDHMNTLSPVVLNPQTVSKARDAQLWAMLHGRNKPSRLVKVQLNASQTGKERRREDLKQVEDDKNAAKKNKKRPAGASRQERGQRAGGTQTSALLKDPRVLAVLQRLGQGCHGIVHIQQDPGKDGEGGSLESFLFLSSDEGRLYRASVRSDSTGAVDPELSLVWEDPKKAFVKGLCVVSNVAYVGANLWKRSSELVAIDISTGQELWRRAVPSARGTLNMLSTPQLSAHSPWLSAQSWDLREGW